MYLFLKSIVLLSMFILARGNIDINMNIENGLEGKEDLNIQCKSKDNDLGQHLLHINQIFHWSFGTRVIGKTLFFCSFQWENGHLLYFDVYDQKRDIELSGDCHWYIHKDGPCRYERYYN